ncbi:MAG TPA: helix-turn-helix transcriptional regulator [Jiangellaceae bacterium]
MTSRSTPSDAMVLFGEEVRIARKACGLTQRQLAARVYCTNSMISMIETAQRESKPDLAERIDTALGCQGRLVRLFVLAGKQSAPRWAARRFEAEEGAVAIRSWQPTVVHGFLQTARYARALFRGGMTGPADEDKLNEWLERRLHRQQVLTAGRLKRFHVIGAEATLYQVVGGAEVMREQLVRLVELVEQRLVTLQILRFDVAVGPSAPMTIYDLADGERVMYLERARDGQTVSDAATIEPCISSFDMLCSHAASFAESVRMVRARIEEL